MRDLSTHWGLPSSCRKNNLPQWRSLKRMCNMNCYTIEMGRAMFALLTWRRMNESGVWPPVEPTYRRLFRSTNLRQSSPDTLSSNLRRIHEFIANRGPYMMQSTVLRRIMRELHGLQETPLDNIRVSINEDDVLQFHGIIAGPGARVFPGRLAILVARPCKSLATPG